MFVALSDHFRKSVQGTYERTYAQEAAALARRTGIARPASLPETKAVDEICPWLDAWTQKEKQRMLSEINETIEREIQTAATEKGFLAFLIVGGIILAVSVILTGCSSKSKKAEEDANHAATIEGLRDSFRANGAEQYIIVVAEDERTCGECGEMSGQVFDIGEFDVGTTAPPFHPQCRCLIEVYIPEEDDSVDSRFEYDWTQNSENDKIAGRVTPEFLEKVVEISDKLGVAPDDLMAIMAWESWLNPFADNGQGYIGLIQFGKVAAEELGTTQQALLAMSAVEQLDYVYEYYALQQRRHGNIHTLTDLYMATLWPRAIGKPDDYVLWDSDQGEYWANAGLDWNNDGKITIGETMQLVLNRRDTFNKK